jgi:alanine dehydrogenase
VRKKVPDGGFDKYDYYSHPELYESKFYEYYDKISFLINCMYWEPKFPRVIIEDEICSAAKSMKFMGFTDISADYEGSIELTRHFLHIEDPYHLYNTQTRKYKPRISDYEDGDILYHCVDHLPAQMPIESSEHFGKKLFPFIEGIVNSDFSKPFTEQDDYDAAIKRAIITCHGELTPKYAYIAKLREANERAAAEEKDAKKPSGDYNFMTVLLKGHLLDTKFFNSALDKLENMGINFKLKHWYMG